MSTVIEASSAKLESLITGGVAAVVDVSSVLSMVNLVDRMDEPPSFISTVKVEPEDWAVESDARTSVTVIARGILNVIFAVPVVSAVVSSEQAA